MLEASPNWHRTRFLVLLAPVYGTDPVLFVFNQRKALNSKPPVLEETSTAFVRALLAPGLNGSFRKRGP